MLKEARYSKILETVNERNFVSFHDLMELTNSSESTIRADLVVLANEGKLIRLRGGAQAIDKDQINYELGNDTKMVIEIDAKKRIAQYAASLIKDRSTVYVDAGTTTLHLIDFITAKEVSIVTNSLSIARKAKLRNFKVYVIGGDIKLSTDAFVGSLAQDIVNRFSFDIGFFGCNGIDFVQGITTPEVEEAIIKQTAMSKCKKLYILADHTKLGVKTAVTFHPFIGSEIITDKITNNNYINKGILEVRL